MLSGYFYNTQLVVRRAGMWPSLPIHREAGQHGCDVSGGKNHIHFNVQNPTADSTARSREDILNTIAAIDVTKYTWRH